MKRIVSSLIVSALTAGCATPRIGAPQASGSVDVQILAFNDFHGALEPPGNAVVIGGEPGAERRVPAGGAAHLASALTTLREGKVHSITVSAGDLTGASPFASSQFLDEPAILAMNMMGVALNAVGNHEFDRGTKEILRLQNGGCEKHTAVKPCQVDRDFGGAQFRYLAANVKTVDGKTLFPATALRRFGRGADSVRVGFIGLTLKGTDALVAPDAVRDVRFADEAETINALVLQLRRDGADAVVVLIHQGANSPALYNQTRCEGLTGDLLPILQRLGPGIDAVVTGHTHDAYLCDYGTVDATRPFLVTSAGSRGMLVTDITLSIDPRAGRVTAKRANNVVVQSMAFDGPSGPVATDPALPIFPADPRVQALVTRYVAAAAPVAQRVVGRIGAQLLRQRNASGETQLGNLVADAQAAATQADIAFMNSGGLRADLVPADGGDVTFGQLYAVQPFGNVLQIKQLTGAQIRAVLEQQFDSGSNTVARPNMLQVSRGFAYSYDLGRPAGHRIVTMTLNGAPIEDARLYRVGISNFLATGGDNFTGFQSGRDVTGGGQDDVVALEAYVARGGVIAPPALGRITRLDAPATVAEDD